MDLPEEIIQAHWLKIPAPGAWLSSTRASSGASPRVPWADHQPRCLTPAERWASTSNHNSRAAPAGPPEPA